MRQMRLHARLSRAIALAVAAAGIGLAPVALSGAASGADDVGTSDFVYGAPVPTSNPNDAPTASKPQSKLWYVEDTNTWYGVLLHNASDQFRIYRYNAASDDWQDTGTVVDTRAKSRADVLWDGVNKTLYTVSAPPTGTTTSDGIQFHRFSYDPSTQTYTRQVSYDKTLNQAGVEAAVIAKDTTNRLWVTWTNTRNEVRVQAGDNGGSSWGASFVVPVPGTTGLDPDDISSVVAHKGSISVVWSKQQPAPTTGPQLSTFYVADHADSSSPTSGWTSNPLISGIDVADDHLNLSVDGDASGRVFLAVKTGADHNDPATPDAALIELWVLGVDNKWTRYDHSTVAENETRPVVVVDRDANKLRVFATGGTTGGTIYEKSTPLDNPGVFSPSGRGTPFISLASDPHINNVTTTKQNVTVGTGLLVLASDQTTGRYVHNATSVPVPDPVASFTTSTSSGVAPLNVTFTNTSTNALSYSWDFGDGTTSTLAAPGTHTYAAPGQYTVALTAKNRNGVPNTVSAKVTSTTSSGPTVSMTRPTAAYTTSRWVGGAWAAGTTAYPPVTYSVERSSVGLTGRTLSAYSLLARTTATSGGFTGNTGTTYCLRVSGRDEFGTAGRVSSPRCTAVPLDDRNLNRSGAWRNVSSKGSYLGTVRRSSRKGSALSRTVAARHVALVATKGPAMGRVAVYRGRTLVKRISLAASSVHKRVTVPVAAYARPVTGTFRIVVISRGRPVLIDGLAVSLM